MSQFGPIVAHQGDTFCLPRAKLFQLYLHRTKRSNYIWGSRDPRIYPSTGSARDVALIRRILIVAGPRAIVPSHLLTLLFLVYLPTYNTRPEQLCLISTEGKSRYYAKWPKSR